MADAATNIALAMSNAQAVLAQAKGHLDTLNALQRADIQLNVPQALTSWNMNTEASDRLGELIWRGPPAPEEISISLPQTPEPPAVSVREMGNISIPQSAPEAPAISIPAPPAFSLPGAPASPPPFSAPTLPDAPVLVLPPVPTLEEIDLPAAPAIDLPVFDGSEPETEIPEPLVDFQFAEPVYDTAMRDAMVQRIIDQIVNGGSGINEGLESRLWTRARDRQQEADGAAKAALTAAFTRSGFPLPAGPYADSFLRLEAVSLAEQAKASMGIAVQSAEWERQAQQFYMQTGFQLEAVLTNAHDAVANRALAVARAVTDYSVELFRIRVERVRAQLDVFTAKAAIFRERIGAALAALEVFKTQMQGAALRGEAQKVVLDLYNARFQGIMASVEVYNAQVRGAQLLAGVEEAKLNGYRSQVDAWRGLVEAKEAELRAYATRVEGERTKVALHASQVDAFRAKVDAATAQAQTLALQQDGDVKKAKMGLEKYDATIRTFEARLRAEAQKADAIARNNTATLGAWQAQADAVRTYSGAVLSEQQAAETAAKEVSRLSLEQSRISLEEQVQEFRLRIEAAKSLASIYGGMASQLSAGVQTLVTQEG